ncbi:MAG: glycine-rich protein [Bradymonadia bacterium]
MGKTFSGRLAFLTCVSLSFVINACGDDSGGSSKKTCGGAICGDDQSCVDDVCVDKGCESKTCNEGWQCIKGICEETVCLDVECGEGRSCKGGTCYDNECLDVTCAGDKVCSKGECMFEACIGKEACGSGKSCDVEGKCQFDVAPAISIDASEDLETDENGDTVSLSVRLNNAPTQEVYITCTVETESPNKEVDVACGEIVFNADNWQNPQSVIITGVQDDLIDGDQKYKVVITTNSEDSDFNGLQVTSEELTNLDRTVAGFVISDTTLTTYEDQEQDAAKFTIALSSIPSEEVKLTFASSNEDEGKLDKTSVSFTAENWNVPQEVSVKGVDDEALDKNVEYAITFSPAESEDTHYNGIQPNAIKVINIDNEVAGIVVLAPEVLEIKEQQDVVLNIKLNTNPKSDVTVSVVVDDISEAQPEFDSVVLTGETWNTGAEVKINGLADHVIDGNQPIKISFMPSSEDIDYNTLEALVVDATVVDIDTADVVTGMAEAAIVKEGSDEKVALSLSLSSIPTDDVTIAVAVSDETEIAVSTSEVKIEKGLWDSPIDIYVSAVDDHIIDGDIKSKVVMTMTSGDANFNGKTKEVEFTTVDNDVAEFDIISEAASYPENSGSEVNLTVALKSEPSADVTVAVSSSDVTELEVTSNKTLTFTKENWNAPQTVTLKVVDDNQADGTQMAFVKFTATSEDTNFNGIVGQSAIYSIIDNEAPSVVLTASPLKIDYANPTAIASVVLGVEPTSDVEVSLAASNAETLSLSPASLTFTPENWNVPQDITLNVDFEKVVTAPAIESIQATATTGGSYKDVKSDKVSLKLLKVPEIQNFEYTGAVQSVDLPAGKYKLEVWGAQGGSCTQNPGKGGYSTGNVTLSTTTKLYIYVGGQGETCTKIQSGVAKGGFNGGGTGYWCSGAGGATHIASATGLLSELSSLRSSIYVVAGGGGGSGNNSGGGGDGGGITGGRGKNTGTNSKDEGEGGTQTTGYAFGQGGDGGIYGYAAGGGGGWYGGYGGTSYSGNGTPNGGGGSGYINTILTNAQTIAGNASMPAPAGSTETGHTGNGYARITLVR